MTVTKNTPATAAPVVATVAPKVQIVPPVPETMNLELCRIKRYMYSGTMYLKDSVYQFKMEDAKTMLQMKDPQGMPVFAPAKPRTRLVQIPAEDQVVRIKRVENVSMPLDDFVRQQLHPKVEPLGRIELGDDDQEIAAKLARADAIEIIVDMGERDSASGVSV